jgi:hypothetical protein
LFAHTSAIVINANAVPIAIPKQIKNTAANTFFKAIPQDMKKDLDGYCIFEIMFSIFVASLIIKTITHEV